MSEKEKNQLIVETSQKYLTEIARIEGFSEETNAFVAGGTHVMKNYLPLMVKFCKYCDDKKIKIYRMSDDDKIRIFNEFFYNQHS